MGKSFRIVYPMYGHQLQLDKDTDQKICKITNHEHLKCQNNRNTPLTIYTHVDNVPRESKIKPLHIPGMYIINQNIKPFLSSSPLFKTMQQLFNEGDIYKFNGIRKTIHTRQGDKYKPEGGPPNLANVGESQYLVHRKTKPPSVAAIYDTFEEEPELRDIKSLMTPTEQKISDLLGFQTLDEFRKNCFLQIVSFKENIGINNHIDNARYGGGPIFTVGIGRERLCYDTFQTTEMQTTWPYETEDPPVFRVYFRAGDIVILDDDMRYNWTHGIPHGMQGAKYTFIYRTRIDRLPYSVYRGYDPLFNGHTVRVFETSTDTQGRKTIEHTTQKSRELPDLPKLEPTIPTIQNFGEKVRPLIMDAIKPKHNTPLNTMLTTLLGMVQERK